MPRSRYRDSATDRTHSHLNASPIGLEDSVEGDGSEDELYTLPSGPLPFVNDRSSVINARLNESTDYDDDLDDTFDENMMAADYVAGPPESSTQEGHAQSASARKVKVKNPFETKDKIRR